MEVESTRDVVSAHRISYELLGDSPSIRDFLNGA